MKAKKMNRTAYILISFMSLALVLFSALFSPFAMRAVTFAEEEKDIVSEYEETNVWDNLQGSTIAGNAFNPEDFPHTEKDKPRLVSLVEFCYSLYADNRDDYGLYVYLYNPQDLAFDTATSRNQIQMKCGSGNSDKYNLQFLNYSKEVGYEGRFWKFKVNLTETQKQNVLKDLDPNGRTYEISGITLSFKTVAEEYPCGQKYTYSGYVKGYGSALAESDTLSCKVDGFENYLELDVKQTCYRPIGDYYNGVQSQLNSCYFRVPEKYFTDYGELNRILCEWWEYQTKPILITETDYLYQKLYSLHGAPVSSFDSAMKFLIVAYSSVDLETWFNKKFLAAMYLSNVEHSEWETDGYSTWEGISERTFAPGFFDDWETYERDNFAAVFLTPNATSYKDTFITPEQLKSELLKNSEKLGERDILNRYNSTLFTDTVDRGHTQEYNRKMIERDDPTKLFWNTTTKSTWQQIFGGYDVQTEYDEMKSIEEVHAEDLTGSDDEISARLRVSAKDVASIKEEFNQCKDERLVLLRYGSSQYTSLYCQETYASASEEDVDAVLVHDILSKMTDEFTAYIAQETVYLDFDIISLWFKAEDGSETEIPVVMSPQDVISGIDPPLDINYHTGGLKWWQIALIVIGVLLAVLLLAKTGLLQYIVKGIVWLICLPFKAIGKLFKRKKPANSGKPYGKKRSGKGGKKKQYKQPLRSGGTAKPKAKSKGAGRQ